MTTAQYKNEDVTRPVFQHLVEWQNGLNQLEEEVKTVQKDLQSQYHERIAELRLHLQNLQSDLQALAQSGQREWSAGWSDFQNNLAELRHSFMQTAAQIKEEEKVDLGWLQGFSDQRTHESAGWAEGMGERPEGSEGWAEGMGHPSDSSEGWVQGYPGHD